MFKRTLNAHMKGNVKDRTLKTETTGGALYTGEASTPGTSKGSPVTKPARKTFWKVPPIHQETGQLMGSQICMLSNIFPSSCGGPSLQVLNRLI